MTSPSITLLQDHPRFTRSKLVAHAASGTSENRDELGPSAAVSDPSEVAEAEWFLRFIVQEIAAQGGLMGVVCSGDVSVRIADAVASVGGIAIGPHPDAPITPQAMRTIITVGRSRFRAIRNEFHAGRSHNAMAIATSGLQEAMKDNVLRGGREGDSEGECDSAQLENISNTPASVLVRQLEVMRPSVAEVRNLIHAR